MEDIFGKSLDNLGSGVEKNPINNDELVSYEKVEVSFKNWKQGDIGGNY